MGMYAEVAGNEFKYSGLVAEAIHSVMGHPEDGITVLYPEDAMGVVMNLNARFKAGMALGRERGKIDAWTCYGVADGARFAAALVEWLNTAKSDDAIMFA